MKDAGIKNAVFRHFWAQRYFVQPEVEVCFASKALGPKRLVTDIDVFALRPNADLTFHRLLNECKTEKNQSPISLALWMAGVVQFCRAHSGCVVMKSPRIEPDHKLAASEIGVLLLSESDFTTYDRAIVGPEGSLKTSVGVEDIQAIAAVGKKYGGLERVVNYVHSDALQEAQYAAIVRRCVGELRTAKGEFDPAKREHTALLCDAIAVMSIGVAECAGTVFHQYLLPEQKEVLSESLKVLLWGGKENYDFFQTVRQQAYQSRPQDGVGSLELPEWNQFVQLVRHILDFPAAGLLMPWLLRSMAVSILRGEPILVDVGRSDLLAIKLAMLMVSYACKATGVPREFEDRLVGPLVRRQAELSHDSASAVLISSPSTLNSPGSRPEPETQKPLPF